MLDAQSEDASEEVDGMLGDELLEGAEERGLEGNATGNSRSTVSKLAENRERSLWFKSTTYRASPLWVKA
jgi:hypothetical protein